MKRNKFKMIKMFLSIIVIVGIISFLFQSNSSLAEEKEMIYQLGEGVEKVLETPYRFSKDHPWQKLKLVYQWPKWEECEDWKEYTDIFSSETKNKTKIADDLPPYDIGSITNHFDKIELGPEIYGRWNRPGLPYPWELTKEERENLEAIDIYHRWFWGILRHNYTMSWDPCFGFLIIDRKGHTRWKVGKQYQKSHKHYALMGKPEIAVKEIFLVDQPEDVRGLGVMTISYMDEEKSDDTFLYLPSLRKVRRMSEGSKQDSFLGTTFHYDDMFPKVNMYDNRIVKTEVFKSPGSHIFGFSENMLKSSINGIGRECWVIEATPKKKWYFGRNIIWIDKENFNAYLATKYDSKGRMLIISRPANILACRSPYITGAKDIYLNQAFYTMCNVQINHKTIVAIYSLEYDSPYHEDDTIMSTEHLVRGYYKLR